MIYEIAQRELPDQPIVSIRQLADQAELPVLIGSCFAELYGNLGRLGIAPTGEPFLLYHSFGPDRVDAEVCVPVGGPVSETDRITSRVLPAATVAETLHAGPYEQLGDAYDALQGWMGQHGFEVVWPVRERYLNEPGPQVQPADYRTIISMPIAHVAVPVG